MVGSVSFYQECRILEFDIDVCALSQKFYTDYPEATYPELMRKDGRPYTCLIIDSRDGYFICIPFRSNIQHKEAFLFTGTNRSKKSPSGLDYKKTVLITNGDYIDSAKAVVDADEYNMVMQNTEKIASEINDYIADYTDHITGVKTLHEREFNRRFRYSTLSYFHDILGLET